MSRITREDIERDLVTKDKQTILNELVKMVKTMDIMADENMEYRTTNMRQRDEIERLKKWIDRLERRTWWDVLIKRVKA